MLDQSKLIEIKLLPVVSMADLLYQDKEQDAGMEDKKRGRKERMHDESGWYYNNKKKWKKKEDKYIKIIILSNF